MKITYLIVGTLLLAGCATFPPSGSQHSAVQDAQAKAGEPLPPPPEPVSLPYDSSLPKYVVAVDAFTYSASGQIAGGGSAGPQAFMDSSGKTATSISDDGSTITTTVTNNMGPAIGQGLAAQLATALGSWPNISQVEADSLKHKEDGTYNLKMMKGEAGPFIVKGVVTEYTEIASVMSKGGGFDLRKAFLGVFGAGLVTNNKSMTNVGIFGTLLGPNADKQDVKLQGSVGIDMKIIDGRTGRFIWTGHSSGTFTTISKASRVSMLGFDSNKNEGAASSMGNATRAALNDSVSKIHDALISCR